MAKKAKIAKMLELRRKLQDVLTECKEAGVRVVYSDDVDDGYTGTATEVDVAALGGEDDDHLYIGYLDGLNVGCAWDDEKAKQVKVDIIVIR